jgi:RHS repeat-associated protein
VIEKYKYDAFGAPTTISSSGTYNNRFKFRGREYSSTFGFYEYRARAYHPGLGRFMSEDPKLFVRRIGLGKSPDDWSFAGHPDEAEYNLFRYCGNDPIDFTDPMGLAPVVVDAETDALAQQADTRDLAAYQGSARLCGLLAKEYATSVYQGNSGAKSLSETRTDNSSRSVRPPEPPGGSRSLAETHNHTDNNRDATTHSHLSKTDVNRGDTTGRTQQVITPDGTQQRYRPSDKPTTQERRQEGGVIEQKQGDKWVPLKGANTNLQSPYDHRNG